MDEKQSSFLLYLSYAKYFRMLSIEERGKLITSIFDYLETGTTVETLSGSAEMAFEFIKDQLDRDAEKYATKCKKLRENGAKGGRPPNQTKPNGFNENQKKQIGGDTDTDTDTDTDNDSYKRTCARARACESVGKPVENSVENSDESSELPPHQSDTYKATRVFKDLWEAYPPHRRGSRSEALNVFKATYSPGVDLLNALSIFKASEEWQKESGRFVPALSKWLDSRAWESDLVKASNEKTQLEEAILKRGQERMAALSAMQKEVKG